jgi:uncharacterized protein YjdB
MVVGPMCSDLTGPTGIPKGTTVTVQYVSPMTRLVGNAKLVDLRVGPPITPVVAITVNSEPQPRARFAFKSIAATPIVHVLTTGTDLQVDSLLGVDTLVVSLVGATIDDSTARLAQDTVIVTALPARTIVTPAAPALNAIGGTIAMTASLEDNAIPATKQYRGRVRWYSTDPAVVTVDSVGTLPAPNADAPTYTTTATAVSNGNAQILTIVEGHDTTITNITVQQTLATYTFTSTGGASPSIGSKGDSIRITAIARDAQGQQLANPAAFQYVADKPTKLAVRATTGWAVALEPDTIRVRIAGRDETQFPNEFIRVIVQQIAAQLSSGSVTGGQMNIPAPGLDTAINATAIDALGNPISLASDQFVYTSSNPSVATVDSKGTIHTINVGTSTIRVVRDTASLSFPVDVSNLPSSITITPDPMAIRSLNETVNATADVRNRATPPGAVPGAVVNWTSLDPTIATVNATGQVTGIAVGSARVVGATQIGGAADTITVNVSNQASSIVLGLASATMASINDTLVVPVTAKNSLGATLPATGVRWRSDATDIVKVSIANDGTVIALKRGEARIIAENADGSVADTVPVTVTNAPASVVLNRTTDNLTALNLTLQYAATIFNARNGIIPQGSASDQSPLTWRSTDPTVATVDINGLATAVGNGGTLIIGETGSGTFATGLRADTATLTVSNDAVASAVNPSSVSITSVGNTQQLIASATNNVGGPVSGLTFTWTTSDASVATVSNTGLVTAAGTGTATITATSGTLQATSTITVTNLPTFIDITLDNITLASVNDFSTLAATLRNALGASLPSTAATWTSDDPLIALVTSDGTVTAKAPGTTKVRAVNPGNAAIKDSITVTVSNAAATITLTPNTTQTLASLGQTLNVSTTVLNQAGQPISNPAVTWDIVAGSSVSVATSGVGTGLVTALTNGTSTVRATSGSVSATLDVIVAQAISPSQSTVLASPSTLVANNVATSTITVQLKDANGNNYVRTPAAVVVMTPSSGIPLTVTDHANGNFTATHPASTTAGTSTVTVTADGTSLGNTAILTFTPGAESHYLVTSSNATPVAGTPVTMTAQLKDANGNNVATAGKTIVWTSSNGGSFGSSTPTNASGLATVTFTTANTVTTHAVTATDNDNIAGTSGAISTTPGAPSKYLVSSSATSVAAGSSATITAQLVDANNNAVGTAGQVVTWSGAPAPSFSSATSATNGSGIASVTFTPNTLAGSTATITGTDAASRTGATGTITTVPGAAAILTLSTSPDANPQSGATFAAQPVVQLRDGSASQNAVSAGYVSVTASVSSGTGTLGGITTVLTNASGVATFSGLSISGAPGANTISFSSSGLTPAAAGVTITAGAANNLLALRPQTQSATVATAVTAPSVRVRDAAGNPVGGVNVTFTLSASGAGGTIDDGSGATAGPFVVVSDAITGNATLTGWTLGQTAGANTVTVSAPGVSNVVFTAPGTAGAASSIVVSGTPSTSATVGTSVSTPPAVIVRDQFGNPVNGAPVTFTLTAPGGTGGSIAPTSPAGVPTASNGTASLTSWALGQTAGTNNNTVTATTTGVVATVTFNASGTPGAAQNMIANSVTSQSVTAGSDAAAPSVIVRDAFNNPKGGIDVTFGVSGGTIAPVGGTVTTGPNGVATLTTWTTGAAAGTNTVTATVSGLTGSPVTFTATGVAGVTTAAQSTVVRTGADNIVADGVTSSTILVTAKDANGNPVAGKTIALDDAGASSTISPASGTSNASGQVAFTVTNTVGETATYTATVTDAGAVVVTQTAQVTFRAGANYLVTPASLTPGAGSIVIITAQLRDAGNVNVPQSGKTIVWSKLCNGGACAGGAAGGSFATPTSLTDAAGKATVALTVSNDIAVDMTVTATDNDALTGTSGTIDVVPGAPHHLTFTTQPNASYQAGATITTVATVKDQFNNTVTTDPNGAQTETVAIDFTSGTNTEGATLGGTRTVNVDWATGTATFNTLTVDKVGNYGFTASDANMPTNLTDGTSGTFDVTVGALHHLSVVTQPNASYVAGAAITTVVEARDQFENPVTTDPNGSVTENVVVDFTGGTNGEGATLGGTKTVAVNWTTGRATFNDLTVNLIGNYSLTATDQNFPTDISDATGNTFSITHAAPNQLVFSTQPNASYQAGATIAPVVLVRDQFGNPVTTDPDGAEVENVTISFTTGTNTEGAILGGTTTVNVDWATGTATFNNLTVDKVGNYGLTGTDGNMPTNLTNATSGTFDITAAALDHFDLALASPQTTAVAFTGTNTLTAKDQFGNTVTTFDASANNVTIALVNASTGTLSNNVFTSNTDFVSGVLNLTAAGLTYTRSAAEASVDLQASSTTVPVKTSTIVTVAIGP